MPKKQTNLNTNSADSSNTVQNLVHICILITLFIRSPFFVYFCIIDAHKQRSLYGKQMYTTIPVNYDDNPNKAYPLSDVQIYF